MKSQRTTRSILILLIGLLTASFSSSAYAWHGDIRYFHRRDISVWRGGNWIHGWHGGRMGWWWFTAGAWYFYTRPMYPYPDPYVPSTIIVQQQPAQPQVVMVQPQPPAPMQQPPDGVTLAPPPAPVAAASAPAQAAPAAPQYWYSCKKPQGYYPYVASCPGGWTPVPATPPQAAQ